MKAKEQLLKYLCMALPYGVMVNVEGYDTEKLIGIENETITTKATPTSYSDKGEYPIDIVKPYLRPMSSMTEDEKREIYDWLVENDVDWFDFSKLRLDEILISFDSSWLLVNWLLEHHFDFMGLIPKGLAIEVTESNNTYKEKKLNL